MKPISLLLNFYSTSVNEEATSRSLVEKKYIPLIRYIKSKKNIRASLNAPLSVLEKLDTWGFSDLLRDIKTLIKEERIELVNSPAFGSNLIGYGAEVAEQESILNEYALGYYFGRRNGFEGEKAILINNVSCYFAPTLDKTVAKTLSELDYDWVLFSGKDAEKAVYKLKGSDIGLVSYVDIKEVGENPFTKVINIPVGEVDTPSVMSLINDLEENGAEFVTVCEFIDLNEGKVEEVGVKEVVEPLKNEYPKTKEYEILANMLENFSIEDGDELENGALWKRKEAGGSYLQYLILKALGGETLEQNEPLFKEILDHSKNIDLASILG